MCCTWLAWNAGPKKSPKIRHLGTKAQLCRAVSLQLRLVSTIKKKPVKQQYLPHTSSQYGELWPTSGRDLLASLGHPSKFQRFLRLGSVTAPIRRPCSCWEWCTVFETPNCTRAYFHDFINSIQHRTPPMAVTLGISLLVFWISTGLAERSLVMGWRMMMRPVGDFSRLVSVHFVSFSALTLLVGWQEEHLNCHLFSEVFFGNRWTKTTEEKSTWFTCIQLQAV